MFLRIRFLLTFLILYEMPCILRAQEYLKELRPKFFNFREDQKLPPVEVPQPLLSHRTGKAEFFNFHDDLMVENDTRQPMSPRPTLMDIVLESSAREGLNAMHHLYGIVEPDMLKNGYVLHDDHPAALLSKFSAPVVESSRREMAAYATLTAAKAFRKKNTGRISKPPPYLIPDTMSNLNIIF
ncbi:uncharacterized protein LOC109612290 [Musca domestica]|uniref:Uncharacterized protein LOC109612290 n=1 Tax=Musca domestica TaxID=7370 RepID=A0A9J7DGK6_MUSDO|nr:uncharacterized protein LOC109612290 [Musca domestica]